MKKRILATSILVGVTVIFSLLLSPHSASSASATVTDISNPDAYICGQTGYITFEPMPDGTNLSTGAINGVQFTTTNGYTWQVGDFATGQYNGKYPSGGYTSQGTHWAWLGVNQGAGRIDFANGPASYFSLLTSDSSSPVYLDAYTADGTLIASAGPAAINYNTGHMDELKIIRDTADIAYVNVHDTGNYFLVDAICTNASGVPNQALNDYKQNRKVGGAFEDWYAKPLYGVSACGNMGGYGCAITSLTDIFTSFGLKTLPGSNTPTDPGSFNNFLAAHPTTYSGCGILWSTTGKVIGHDIKDYRNLKSPDDYTPIIDKALADNNLVVALIISEPFQVKNKDGTFQWTTTTHFVVFYQRAPQNAPDGSTDYYILDPLRYSPFTPGNDSGMTLWNAHHETIKQIDAFYKQQGGSFQIDVVTNKAPQPGKAWAIVLHSPATMLITAPDGTQTGYDPSTGLTVQNIADSSYGKELGIGDEDPQDNPVQPDFLYFGQNVLQDGVYKVQVTGTASGPYELDFNIAGGPTDESVQTVSGNTTPGQVDTYTVAVADGKPVVIQQQVKIDIWPYLRNNLVVLKDKISIPVAILSTPDFDATKMVDQSSLTFGKTGDEATLKSCLKRTPDVNKDGLPDLICIFNSGGAGFALGDKTGTLKGKTVTGLLIQGTDTIQVLPARNMYFYKSILKGGNEVPSVSTFASGAALFAINPQVTKLSYSLSLSHINNVTSVAIYCSPSGENGPAGVTIYQGTATSKKAFIGMIQTPDPDNACGWTDLVSVVNALYSGNAYLNVTSMNYPSGEIRGQIQPVMK